MQTAEKHDLDALAALPEMKEVLSEIREVYKIQLSEINRAFDEVDDGEVPDVSHISDKYDGRLRELRKRVNEIARTHAA